MQLFYTLVFAIYFSATFHNTIQSIHNYFSQFHCSTHSIFGAAKRAVFLPLTQRAARLCRSATIVETMSSFLASTERVILTLVD